MQDRVVPENFLLHNMIVFSWSELTILGIAQKGPVIILKMHLMKLLIDLKRKAKDS